MSSTDRNRTLYTLLRSWSIQKINLAKNIRVGFGNFIGLSTCNDSRTAERFLTIWSVLLASLRLVSVLAKVEKITDVLFEAIRVLITSY